MYDVFIRLIRTFIYVDVDINIDEKIIKVALNDFYCTTSGVVICDL